MQVSKKLIVIFSSLFLAVAISVVAIGFAQNQEKASAANSAETIDSSYLVMKGTPGTVSISNFIKLGMEPIGHAMYIYGGGWNEADDGGGIEANTIGVAKSWKDFERAQDNSYTNMIEPLDYTVHKEVIHYGLDCSAYVGWIYYNMFNDGKDHVTYASDMGDELVTKGLATKTRDVDSGTGTCTFTPGDVMTSGGHVWICLGKCSDGSVLTLQCQGCSDETNPDKYEGVSLYGTTTPSGSKNSEAIALANEYLNRYYPAFNSKYKSGYAGVEFLTDYNEYTWKSTYDTSELQSKTPAQVLATLFGETSATVTCSATGTTPTIKINDAYVTANSGTSQAYNYDVSSSTVKITLEVPYTQQFNSIVINGTDYSSQIPKTSAALSSAFYNGYTRVALTVTKADKYAITSNVSAASTVAVGTTNFSYGTDNHIANIQIEGCTVATANGEVTEPKYYSSIDWVNNSKNGYGAFPAGSTVRLIVKPQDGYKVDSIGTAAMNVAATSTANEYTFVVPAGQFSLDIQTSVIEQHKDNPDNQQAATGAVETYGTAQTGDSLAEISQYFIDFYLAFTKAV